MSQDIASADGKLGILLPGMGAVATTLIAGVLAVNKGISKPIGSTSQMGTIRIGKRTEDNTPLIKDFIPLADLTKIEFGGWDLFEENVYESAKHAGVLDRYLLEQLKPELEAIKPMKAVFDKKYVTKLEGTYKKEGANKMELAEMLRQDIRDFKENNNCDRLVMVWCGSTEIYIEESAVHQTVESLEEGMRNNDENVPSSMLYAYAAIMEGVPYANGAPNLSADIPALIQLAKQQNVPICGKDFKTGQTLMKTILAPGLKTRSLGIAGWFSTNILGNRDGEVLDDPASFKTKEMSKLSVLDSILEPEKNPDLYKDLYHKVRINYYPPHGDNKEGWDNIDIFGWLGYKMQIKVDFLCRDSILAAPLVLDLAIFLDLASRANMGGIQEWLSFFFKAPQTPTKDMQPLHDIFKQEMKLKNTLRYLQGEDLITHLGQDYDEKVKANA
ncbi:MAG: inositol-3-phosphate synthase [Flavobacteriales bacterium]|nr:inositol-3-phosphate synthase [Flavobacteriales bacterium]NQX96780.1 inositol-3-phosphate synthase [Flavobacteriales bacterium]